MKQLIVYFLVVALLFSCSKTGDQNKKGENNKKSIQHKKEKSKKGNIESEPIAINIHLPFGSQILVSHKFPEHWENTSYGDSEPSENENLFNNVSQFYYKLDIIKVAFPKVSKVEYVNLSFPWKFNDSLLQVIDSCQYRLPNLGPYIAYFSYNTTYGPYKEKEGVDFEEHDPYLISYGNLILIDPKSRNTKILNICANISAPFTAYSRYFYLDNKGNINIYESEIDEEFYTFKKRYSISIKKDGQIKIKELKGHLHNN